MTKTMKVESPLHVICQCDKCKPQISFNAEVIGYVEPQRTWVGLTDDEVYRIAFELEGEQVYRIAFEFEGGHWRKIVDAIEAKLKEKNNG